MNDNPACNREPRDAPMKPFRHLLILAFSMGALAASQGQDRPNVIFILVDDMGYSDLGCYGSEIQTPHIDSLAGQGIRFTQMYNTSKCFPSRATLLTGVYAQQCGMQDKPLAMVDAVTLGEVLRTAGYRTFASGKHHGTENLYHRGFDHYYGLRDGSANLWNPGVQRPGEPEPARKGTVRYWCDDEKTYQPYTPEDRDFYTTDAFTDKALQWLDEPELDDQPFFLYLAYTAPHYPLQARPEDIAKYDGTYDAGYEAVRAARYQRMIEMGVIPPETPLPAWREDDWEQLNGLELRKEKLRMEIYAAMVDSVDQNVGRLLDKLEEQGKRENTLIMFASDNGACAENANAKISSTRIEDFGTLASYETVGRSWATVQNTPLRNWKNYSHEGGIGTPFVLSWPARIKNVGGFYREPAHFIDIMPTLVELSGATYPDTFDGAPITPMQGISLTPAFDQQPLNRPQPIFWEWRRGGAIREGNTKAVFLGTTWELFDLSTDPNEQNDLSKSNPELLQSLQTQWRKWSKNPDSPL